MPVLPFLARPCRYCNCARAAQLHTALERCWREPNPNEPNRNVSFCRVHDGEAWTPLGLVSLVDRAQRLCMKDGRCVNGSLAERLVLVGFWTDEDSQTSYVHAADSVAVESELRQMTLHGIDHHVGSDECFGRVGYWSTRYDEVVVDRYTLPAEAWQRKWLDIPEDIPPLAVKLMQAWTKNDDVMTMARHDDD